MILIIPFGIVQIIVLLDLFSDILVGSKFLFLKEEAKEEDYELDLKDLFILKEQEQENEIHIN